MARIVLDNHVELSEVDHGILVRQQAEAYVARNWRITPAVVKLLKDTSASGLECMIRDNHPLRKARWPNPRGVVYLAFSVSPKHQWSIAIDTFKSSTGDFGHAVFNGKYHSQFITRGLPFKFEGRNKTSGHLVVKRQHFEGTLKEVADFDHSVLSLKPRTRAASGFATEYDIQHAIISRWQDTPWGDEYEIVQDEYPVDGGLTSRRIDILARHPTNGDWLVIELKRAEASDAAVRQVVDYLRALGQQDQFAVGALQGVLVGERISANAQTLALSEGVAAFELSWPFHFNRIV
ncbi:DUF91 domain-containing protein [Hyphobacterium sp. CCMP332]|uniref:endonuclease NucS domain-containing protein n=1 Tax=Hyphobacterium sp. CCMP332 TaxID=2749086 RepID=UPI001650ACBA|nr:endonuclease NucS domain-containing protein [Hyphobacterium sp. CCMP332]QNL18863.1 DUF91 domain-containing protein [Hyphobacterium sp. CCMP332]